MRPALPLVFALCSISLLGCPGKEKPAVKPHEINLWHTFNPEETATLNRILAQIRIQHPEWRVHPTVIPFARAQNKFRQGAQSCETGAPHVFRAELPWLAEFVSKGLIRPVPDGVSRDLAYLPQAEAAARYKGRRWVLTSSLDCLALLYNRELVKTPPANLGQLVATARRLTVDDKGRTAESAAFDPTRTVRWGFYIRAEAYWFLPFLWAHDGRLLTLDPPKVHIDEPEAVAALAFYRDLIHRHHVAPPRPSPSNDYEDQMQRFGVGKLAMMINGPWAMSSLLSRPVFRGHPERLGVAPFPSGPSRKPAAPLSGHGWVISRCAPDPKAAWALAARLSDVSAQATFARRNSLLPAVEAAYADARVRHNRFVAEFRAALARARPRPQHPAIARIFDDFNPAVQAVILGDADPGLALAGVARAWRRLLGLKRPEEELKKPAEPEKRR
jgi:arabinogalactan oligomer/maltooligosaccharide transport system substrate-binding protein